MRTVAMKDYKDGKLLIDILHIEGTEFLVLNRYNSLEFLKYTDLSTPVQPVQLPNGSSGVTRLILQDIYIIVGTDIETVHVLELSEQFLPY